MHKLQQPPRSGSSSLRRGRQVGRERLHKGLAACGFMQLASMRMLPFRSTLMSAARLAMIMPPARNVAIRKPDKAVHVDVAPVPGLSRVFVRDGRIRRIIRFTYGAC